MSPTSSSGGEGGDGRPSPDHRNHLLSSAIRQLYVPTPRLPLDPETLALFRWSRPDLYNLVGQADAGEEERKAQESKLVEHIVKTRDKIMLETQYPCLAAYAFLVPGMVFQEPYGRALDLLRNDEGGTRRPTFLDLGCGLGQDIRAILSPDPVLGGAGIPAERCVASDLLGSLMRAGFELFGDREGEGGLEGVKWVEADVFKRKDLERLKKLTNGGEGYDVIFLGSFLHLFSLSAQKRCLAALDYLLSRRPGSIIFGRQTGCDQAYNVVKRQEGSKPAAARSEHEQGEDPQSEVFRHDARTFKLLAEQGKVGIEGIDVPGGEAQRFKWRCDSEVHSVAAEGGGKDPRRNAKIKEGEGMQRRRDGTADGEQTHEIKSLHFCITRT